MTAKEMFEALGYSQIISTFSGYIIEYINGEITISFDKDYKSMCSNAKHISIKLHNAIHQQMKELGWEDDSERKIN